MENDNTDLSSKFQSPQKLAWRPLQFLRRAPSSLSFPTHPAATAWEEKRHLLTFQASAALLPSAVMGEGVLGNVVLGISAVNTRL